MKATTKAKSAPTGRAKPSTKATVAKSPPEAPTGPDLAPARALFDAGFKLVKLKRNSKAPVSHDWRNNTATEFDDSVTGYGMLLEENQRCSIDPDNTATASIGLKALGFDLEQVMAAGVRTVSTRPGSGGRSVFVVPDKVRRVVFKTSGGTALELNMGKRQDVVPGLVYTDSGGNACTQRYVNGVTYADEKHLPADVVAWWRRLSNDNAFRLEQQRLFALACGDSPEQARKAATHCDLPPGAPLPFKPRHVDRMRFNRTHDVEQMLAAHGYATDGTRWAPPTASGAPGSRCIPGRDGLWQSDHASDPLMGTFDAWCVFVLLDHGGELAAAEKAARQPSTSELLGGLSKMAKNYGVETEQAEPDEPTPDEAPQAETAPHPLANYVALNLDRLEAPEFVIDNCIQAGVVVLSGGHGQGKSIQLASLMAKVAHLCKADDPLRPRLRRRVIYITEDVHQIKRTLAALQRFGGSGCSAEDFEKWFKVVPASRGDAGRFTEVKPEYLKLDTPNTSPSTGKVFMAKPVVVVDTKSAVFNIEDDNDNAEGSEYVAELKQEFALPLIVVGHLAKALNRADVTTMSMRGANSWEADAHQTIYLYADEKLGRTKRFMHFALPGKRRFEDGIDVLEFDGHTNCLEGFNKLGESVLVNVRHSTCMQVSLDELQEAKTNIKETLAEQKKQDRDFKLSTEWRSRILQALGELNRPVSRQNVADHLKANTSTIKPYMDALIDLGQVVTDGKRGGSDLWKLAAV